MLVGLASGLLQSSIYVTFDSSLPLIVNRLFGMAADRTGPDFHHRLASIPFIARLWRDNRQISIRKTTARSQWLSCWPPGLRALISCHAGYAGSKGPALPSSVIIRLTMVIAMPAIIAEIGATVADAKMTRKSSRNPSLPQDGALSMLPMRPIA